MSNIRQYSLKVTADPEGARVEIDWPFKNPTEAGYVVGALVSALEYTFESDNPSKPSGQALKLILAGMLDSLIAMDDVSEATKGTH